jgi:hypothetical protein
MADERPPMLMQVSTIAAPITMDSQSGQPRSASSTSASAYRFTPAISTCATAKLSALSRWVGWLNRRRRNSGTLRTLEP